MNINIVNSSTCCTVKMAAPCTAQGWVLLVRSLTAISSPTNILNDRGFKNRIHFVKTVTRLRVLIYFKLTPALFCLPGRGVRLTDPHSATLHAPVPANRTYVCFGRDVCFNLLETEEKRITGNFIKI